MKRLYGLEYVWRIGDGLYILTIQKSRLPARRHSSTNIFLHIALFNFVLKVDGSLVSKFNRGNKNAFRQVFDMYFEALCAFGYNYLREVSAVEDLVQDAFISLWEKHQDFDNLEAVKSFLYTTVRNKCLNHLKHKLVRQKNEDALIFELESAQHFEGRVIEEEVFNQLSLEIRNLPDSARKIMLLALNGLSNPEMAAKLDISVNTVKTQKKLAYAKLKDRLSPLLRTILLSL